jgi:hypothetical protein
MTTIKTVTATVWAVSAAATIGLAAPAHADSAVNLPLTDEVRAELVQAGAALTGHPASDYSGLRPGHSYYAYQPDSTSPYYWAAAALWGPKTEEAAIQLQDQNSYIIFRKGPDPAATWLPIADGFGPIRTGDTPCPLPESVRDLWQWPAGKCYPPS